MTQDFFENKNIMLCHEFLYLIPNTICKSKTVFYFYLKGLKN